MSKVQLAGNANGTGIFTIASPNSNTDRTLTLPNSSGTLLNNSSTAGFPAGSLLQVVQVTTGATETVLSGSFQTTVMSATITPSSSSSKIFIITQSHGAIDQSGSSDSSFGERILRGSTVVLTNGETFYSNATSGQVLFQHFGCQYLDSPATTSPVTYNYQITGSNRGQMRYNRGSTTGCVITLMEIAG